MMQSLPWWGWGLIAAGIAVVAIMGLGNKVGGGVAVALLLAVLGQRQRQAGYEDRKREERDEGWKTRERMDDADIVGDDPHVARDWLRERGKHKR